MSSRDQSKTRPAIAPSAPRRQERDDDTFKFQYVPKLEPEARVIAGRWRALGVIAEGGMGTVWRGEEIDGDGSIVAIKLLRPLVSSALNAEARLEREAELLGSLDHPSIVPLLDHGRDGDDLFLVMPYIEGRPLSELLDDDHRPLGWWQPYLRTICDALQHAHAHGVIHRDLKPNNLMIHDQPGALRLMDFSVALDQRKERLTHHGVILGTPVYMAPEQFIEKGRITPQTDQYSLAVITYEVLTGRPPFFEQNYTALIFKHSIEPPEAPSRLVASLPPAVDHAILRALSKVPEERFPSCSDFAAALAS